jgi:NAD(P)-dependent dehydrogenase (short-subunit alcohol dehydrogenase family)
MAHPTEDGQLKEIHLTRGEFIVVIYNASSRVPGPISSVDPEAVEKAIAITTFGAFLAAQQAAKRMEPKGRGAIFFTGASAGMKGFAQSAAFAMGKFGLRGLAQSAARELGRREYTSRTSTSTEASAHRADLTRPISLTAR